MTKSKRNLTQKVAAGAILVALSGFVPNVTRQAQAATATITASGSFTGGLTMTAGTNLQFGKMVATNTGGKLTVNTAGGTVASKGFFNTLGATNGTIKFNAGALKAVDFTVAGPAKTLALASTANGGKTGVVNLSEIVVAGPIATALTFTTGSLKQSATLTSLTTDLSIGGQVTWGAVQPLGSFTHADRVIANY
ncbi:MAG: DUF4402 domain-containing protein [Pseudomonadota bacterium]